MIEQVKKVKRLQGVHYRKKRKARKKIRDRDLRLAFFIDNKFLDKAV
jgi:hypothetical protein